MATLAAIFWALLWVSLVLWLWLRAEYRLFQARQDVEILADELSRLLPVKPKRKPGRRSYQERLKREIDEMVAKVQGGW